MGDNTQRSDGYSGVVIVVQNSEINYVMTTNSREIPVDTTSDGRFGSKVGQIGPKWEKSGAFSDQISVYLAPRAKYTEI